MAIEKPGWLKGALGHLNWDILTWHVYVGDTIEEAIDWVLGWINWVINEAEKAWNKAVDAWNKAVDLGRELQATINSEIQKVLSNIDTWWDSLGEWWEVKRSEIIDLIDVAGGFIGDTIDDVGKGLNNLVVWWQAFRTDILPTLINLNWFYEFMGAKLLSIWEWWETELVKVQENIEASVKPVRDEVNRHTSWLELIKDFIDDPVQWFYDRLDEFFVRFW